MWKGVRKLWGLKEIVLKEGEGRGRRSSRDFGTRSVRVFVRILYFLFYSITASRPSQCCSVNLKY